MGTGSQSPLPALCQWFWLSPSIHRDRLHQVGAIPESHSYHRFGAQMGPKSTVRKPPVKPIIVTLCESVVPLDTADTPLLKNLNAL